MEKAVQLIVKLCNTFDKNGVKYCHWKSNNNIHLTMSGVNDVDLLVERKDEDKVLYVLNLLAFKEFVTVSQLRVNGIVNYYGYDSETGLIIHVHLHYRLIIGHDFYKNYRLPIEDAFIKGAMNNGCVKVPVVELEFVVFIIRMVLKITAVDILSGKYKRFVNIVNDEMKYFESNVKETEVDAIRSKVFCWLTKEMFDKCCKMIKGKLNLIQMYSVRKKMLNKLKQFSINKKSNVDYEIFKRRILQYLLRRKRDIPKKVKASGGVVIAVLGGDGSGKTTMVKVLSDWLKKIKPLSMHMGKPPRSIKSKLLDAILTIVRIVSEKGKNGLLINSRFYKKIKVYRKYLHALDRKENYKRAETYSGNGGVVICDRYYLSEVEIMDGPVINKNENNRLFAKEKKEYDEIQPPDICIVLKVSEEVAVKRVRVRSPNEDLEMVRRRNQEIAKIDNGKYRVYGINSELKLDEVVREVKEVVWRNI